MPSMYHSFVLSTCSSAPLGAASSLGLLREHDSDCGLNCRLRILRILSGKRFKHVNICLESKVIPLILYNFDFALNFSNFSTQLQKQSYEYFPLDRVATMCNRKFVVTCRSLSVAMTAHKFQQPLLGINPGEGWR